RVKGSRGIPDFGTFTQSSYKILTYFCKSRYFLTTAILKLKLKTVRGSKTTDRRRCKENNPCFADRVGFFRQLAYIGLYILAFLLSFFPGPEFNDDHTVVGSRTTDHSSSRSPEYGFYFRYSQRQPFYFSDNFFCAFNRRRNRQSHICKNGTCIFIRHERTGCHYRIIIKQTGEGDYT